MGHIILNSGRCFKRALLSGEKTIVLFPRNLHSSKIEIPKRIERGPLDVLKALAATIKNEGNVNDYRLQYGGIFDDHSNYMRKIVTLAMDSGRRAAKWVVQNNPDLFNSNYAAPPIKAFTPAPPVSKDTVSEDLLMTSISNHEVQKCIEIYEAMIEKNLEVSEETKQLLLELLCYYNCKNAPDPTLVESKYYALEVTSQVNSWNRDCLAEVLFLEMEPSSEIYTTLILGRMKHGDILGGVELFKQGKTENMKFGVEVYNMILQNIITLKNDHEEQKSYCVELLTEMRDNKIKPNLNTLNSVLKTVHNMRKWSKARYFAVEVYQEFKQLGIQPCLATYYYLLQIFQNSKRMDFIIREVMNEIFNKSFIPQHPDDFKFFVGAMDIASYVLHSPEMAKRIHDVLLFGNNRCFLNSNLSTMKYYSTYFSTLFKYDNFRETVNQLELLVPHTFIPEPSVTLILVEAMNVGDNYKYAPKVWQCLRDVILESRKVSLSIVETLAKNYTANSSVKYVDITKEIWKELTEPTKKRRDADKELTKLSAFLKIFSISAENELANAVFRAALNSTKRKSLLDIESLRVFVDLCIKNDDKAKSMMAIKYMALENLKVSKELLECAKSKLNYNEDDVKSIETFFATQCKAP